MPIETKTDNADHDTNPPEYIDGHLKNAGSAKSNAANYVSNNVFEGTRVLDPAKAVALRKRAIIALSKAKPRASA